MCVFRFEVLIFAIGLNSSVLVSLSFDCFVAVCWPMKFHSIMTTKQFWWANSSLVAFFAIKCFIFIPYFGLQHEGYLQTLCDLPRVMPIPYLLFNFLLGAIVWSTVFILNVNVTIGVLLALVKRQNLTSGENKMSGTLLKLVIRLLVIILASIGSNIPLSIELLGIKLLSLLNAFSIAIMAGFWNVFFFVASDRDLRVSFGKTFSCNGKKSVN